MKREEIESKIRGLEIEIEHYYDLIDENIEEEGEEYIEDYYDRINEIEDEIEALKAMLESMN